MNNEKRSPNYDVLDKILRDADIPERTPGRTYIPDPNDPKQNMPYTEAEDLADIVRQNDAIEKYLRS